MKRSLSKVPIYFFQKICSVYIKFLWCQSNWNWGGAGQKNPFFGKKNIKQVLKASFLNKHSKLFFFYTILISFKCTKFDDLMLVEKLDSKLAYDRSTAGILRMKLGDLFFRPLKRVKNLYSGVLYIYFWLFSSPPFQNNEFYVCFTCYYG